MLPIQCCKYSHEFQFTQMIDSPTSGAFPGLLVSVAAEFEDPAQLAVVIPFTSKSIRLRRVGLIADAASSGSIPHHSRAEFSGNKQQYIRRPGQMILKNKVADEGARRPLL